MQSNVGICCIMHTMLEYYIIKFCVAFRVYYLTRKEFPDYQ